jgi:hypothetical protein
MLFPPISLVAFLVSDRLIDQKGIAAAMMESLT